MSAPPPRFAVEDARYRALFPALRGVAKDPQTARLARALALSDGFMLHLVGCESHQAAEALLLCLATLVPRLLGHDLKLACLTPTRPAEGPLQPEALAREVFERLLAPDPEPRAVFLDATDSTEADRPAWRWLLQRLNERRNHLPAMRVPLTLLLPLDLEMELPALAPDLWSIRSAGARYIGLLSLPGSQTLLPLREETRPELDYDARELRAELEDLLAQPGPQARRAAVAVFGRLAAKLAEQGQAQEVMTILQQRMLPSLAASPPVLADQLRFELVGAVHHEVASAEQLESLVRELVLPATERLGDEFAATQALEAVANAYGRAGENDRMIRILEDEVLPRARALPDRTYEVDLLAKLAATHLRLGEREAADRILEQLNASTSTRPSPTMAARLFGALAGSQLAAGQPTEAITTLRHRLIPLYDQIHDEELKAMGWVFLGQALASRGDQQAALEVWRDKALPIVVRMNQSDGVAFIQGLVAVALRDLGRPDAALAYLRRKALPPLAKAAASSRAARERRRALHLHAAAAFESLGKREAARRLRAAAELPAEQDLSAVLAEAASAEDAADPAPTTPVLHTAAGPEIFEIFDVDAPTPG